MFSVNVSNTRKLFTNEDPFNMHKVLGVISLTHFAVRYYNLFAYGDMRFTGSLVDVGLLLCHWLLSLSSLIFPIPSNRVRSMIVIWPEFRVHSILFATRTLLCVLSHFFLTDIRAVSGLLVVLTMLAADAATACFRTDRTTMRGMSWPDLFPLNHSSYQKAHNLFYSASQVGATLSVLLSNNPDYPFMMLLPIQIAPLLSTLVKKGIIRDFHWHLVYTASLSMPYFYHTITGLPPPVPIFPVLLISIARFVLRIDKYVLWLIVMCVF